MSKKIGHIKSIFQIKFLNNSYLFIFLLTGLFYLPILHSPSSVLNRDNDLQQQFWPIFYFIKEQFLKQGEFPLWNNMFFSGMPLLPDPQFSFFYPLNWFFLLLPTDLSFIVYFIIHIFLGGVAIYLLTKNFLNLSKIASFFAVTLFIFSPRLAGYIEAGHSGLIASWGLLPWVLLSTLILSKRPTYRWLLALSLSLVGIFFTHTVTFILALAASGILFITSLITGGKFSGWKNKILPYGLGLLATFGLAAVSLLPQIEWIPTTTRSLLINAKDIYPKWSSLSEFVQNIFLPWVGGLNQLWAIDTEKWLAFGLGSSTLALWGFWHLSNKTKAMLLAFFIPIILISLNNTTPVYKLLIKTDWYVLMRVATRIWFIPAFTVIILASIGLDHLLKVKMWKFFVFLIIFASLAETLLLSWTRILKPLPNNTDYVPQQVYQFLKNDREQFRVFCPERCFSQQEATKANLELIEGYNTLQSMNYFKHMWQLSGGYWNYYTLALPPQGDFQENRLQPDALSLGSYNTKYVLSTYSLNDKNFAAEKQIEKYTIYKNNLFRTRAYFKSTSSVQDEAPIIKFSPNHIRVDTSKHLSKQLILAEVYSPGWKAYLNGVGETKVLETPVSLRLVDIQPDTEYVDFRYQPNSYNVGKIITIATIALLFGIPVLKRYKI